MPETNILVVVNADEARAAYEEALCRIGAAYEVAATFREALGMAIERPFNGVMIDILTLVRSDKDEKLVAYDCMNLYPSIRVKWDGRKQEINLSLLEQSFVSDAAASLRYFVEERCRNFPPRSLRRHHRTTISLSLLLGTSPSLADAESVKTFTINLSPGGAFVHTTLPLRKGAPVWLRFCELTDPTPIRASVRWSIEWGARGIPGAGLAFEELTATQAEEIAALARG